MIIITSRKHGLLRGEKQILWYLINAVPAVKDVPVFHPVSSHSAHQQGDKQIGPSPHPYVLLKKKKNYSVY